MTDLTVPSSESIDESAGPGAYGLTPGTTTISPDVIITIIRLTTLGIDGVSRLTPLPRSAHRRLFRRDSQGVAMEVRNDAVYADIYIAVRPNLNLRDLSRNVQRSINRAIEEMVGMQVGRINVHIEDIDFA